MGDNKMQWILATAIVAVSTFIFTLCVWCGVLIAKKLAEVPPAPAIDKAPNDPCVVRVNEHFIIMRGVVCR